MGISWCVRKTGPCGLLHKILLVHVHASQHASGTTDASETVLITATETFSQESRTSVAQRQTASTGSPQRVEVQRNDILVASSTTFFDATASCGRCRVEPFRLSIPDDGRSTRDGSSVRFARDAFLFHLSYSSGET